MIGCREFSKYIIKIDALENYAIKNTIILQCT
jgi:hypothetical protein